MQEPTRAAWHQAVPQDPAIEDSLYSRVLSALLLSDALAWLGFILYASAHLHRL